MTQEAIQEQIRQALDHRVAVRVYDENRDISRQDMELLMDAAWLSPSSVGLEGWRFLVLDRAQIQTIRPELKPLSWGAQPQLDTASHFVILLAEKNARYDGPSIRESLIRRGLTSDQDLEGRIALYETFQIKCMGLETPRALHDWTSKQTYIAMANMMFSASLLGIDSCAIEGFNYTDVNSLLAAKGWLAPEREGVACMLSLGYRLKDPKHPRSRKPRQEVVCWIGEN